MPDRSPQDPDSDPPQEPKDGDWTPREEPPSPSRVDAARFVQTLHARMPRVHVTYGIIAVNVAIYVAMVASGVHPLSPDIQDMIRWGADYPGGTLDGQPWRLFTSMFLHFGALHLAFNMWILRDLGQLIERVLGHVGFLVLYLGSGVIASEVSLVFHPWGVSAGASGAVFGVFGALLALLVRASGLIPKEQIAGLRRSAFSFLLLNLVIGSAIPSINMAAHAGGLVAGFVFGWLLAAPDMLRDTSGRARRNALMAVCAVALIAVGFYAQPEPFADAESEYDHAFEVMEVGRLEYNRGVEQLNLGSLTEDGFAALIRDEILPDWRAVCERLDAFGPIAPPLVEPFDRLKEFSRARERALVLQIDALEDPGNEEAATRARAAWSKTERLGDAFRDGP